LHRFHSQKEAVNARMMKTTPTTGFLPVPVCRPQHKFEKSPLAAFIFLPPRLRVSGPKIPANETLLREGA